MSASFTTDGEFLKALINAMNVVATQYIEFTRSEVRVIAADPSRVMLLNVRITPPDYRCDVDSVWVYSSQLESIGKKLVKKRNYKVEVKDSKFEIGHFEVGDVIKEEDVLGVEDDRKALANLEKSSLEGSLKVTVEGFRRIVKNAETVRMGEWSRDKLEYVGFKVEGRKGFIVFYLDKEQFSAPIDLQTFPDWFIDSEGNTAAVYRLDQFSSMMLLGLSDYVTLDIRTGKVLRMSYIGRYWSADFWLGSYEGEEAVEVLEAILAKPKPVRKRAWHLQEKQLGDFVKAMKAIAAVLYGNVNIGVSGDELLVYWQNGATCVFRMPKHFFTEFDSSAQQIGELSISDFNGFLRNVEDLKCYLEGDPVESLVFVGSGAKIPAKEFKSERLVKTVALPDIGGKLIFSGETKTLQSIFEDALVAEDEFLIFIASGFEITAVGRNRVYYTATLPLDGFQIQSENYVATTQLDALRNFFSYIPAEKASIGKDGINVTVEAETTIGPLKAVIFQVEEDLKPALEIYEEYRKAPTVTPEVKPLVEPAPKKELTLEQIWDASNPDSRKTMLLDSGVYPYADIDITVQKAWKDLEPAEQKAIEKAWRTLPEEEEEEKPPSMHKLKVGDIVYYLHDPKLRGKIVTLGPQTFVDVLWNGETTPTTTIESELLTSEQLPTPPAPTAKPLTEEDVLSVIPFREQGIASLDQIIVDLKQEGFDLGDKEQKLRGILNELIKKGDVFEPRPGFYSWTISEEESIKKAEEEAPIPEEPEQTVYVKVHVEGGMETDKEGKPRIVTPEFVLIGTTYEEYAKHGGNWQAEELWSRPIVGMYGVKLLDEILKEAQVEYNAIEDNQLTWGDDWAAIREALAQNPSPFNKYAKFIIKWRPEDLEWTESAKQAYDIYKHKYTRDDLSGMNKRQLQIIAKIKDLSTSGEQEDLIGTIVAAGAYAEEIKAAEEEVPEWAIVKPEPTEAPGFKEGEMVRHFGSEQTQTITKKQWSPKDKEWFYQLDNEDRWWRERSLRLPPKGRTIWIYNPTYGSLQEKSLEETLPEESPYMPSEVAWERPLKDSEKYELLEKGFIGIYPEEFFLIDPKFNLDMNLVEMHKRQVEVFEEANRQGEAFEWKDTEGNIEGKIKVSFVPGPMVDIINNNSDDLAAQALIDSMLSRASAKYKKQKGFQEACNRHAQKLVGTVRSIESYPTLKLKFPWAREKEEVKPVWQKGMAITSEHIEKAKEEVLTRVANEYIPFGALEIYRVKGRDAAIHFIIENSKYYGRIGVDAPDLKVTEAGIELRSDTVDTKLIIWGDLLDYLLRRGVKGKRVEPSKASNYNVGDIIRLKTSGEEYRVVAVYPHHEHPAEEWLYTLEHMDPKLQAAWGNAENMAAETGFELVEKARIKSAAELLAEEALKDLAGDALRELEEL